MKLFILLRFFLSFRRANFRRIAYISEEIDLILYTKIVKTLKTFIIPITEVFENSDVFSGFKHYSLWLYQ